MADNDLWSREGSVGSGASFGETLESAGETERQDSATIAQQELQKSRISKYIRHQDPYISAPRYSEAVAEAASRISMADTLCDLGFLSNRDARNQSPPEVESSSHKGNIVEATNTAVEKIQTITQSSPGTLLDVDNRLLKPREYFENLEKVES